MCPTSASRPSETSIAAQTFREFFKPASFHRFRQGDREKIHLWLRSFGGKIGKRAPQRLLCHGCGRIQAQKMYTFYQRVGLEDQLMVRFLHECRDVVPETEAAPAAP